MFLFDQLLVLIIRISEPDKPTNDEIVINKNKNYFKSKKLYFQVLVEEIQFLAMNKKADDEDDDSLSSSPTVSPRRSTSAQTSSKRNVVPTSATTTTTHSTTTVRRRASAGRTSPRSRKSYPGIFELKF